MSPDRETIEALVGSELIERPLLDLQDIKWRPHLGSEAQSIAVHIEETEDLGNSICRRITAALAAGTRVYVASIGGPVSLTRESQEFLLRSRVGILAPTSAEQPALKLHTDFAEAVREHGTLLDSALASKIAAEYLEKALESMGDGRGRALETALAFAASQVPGWRVRAVNYHTENEELDIVVANNSAKSPWNGSSFVMLEAKNWSSNVDRVEYDAFHMKVKERGGACRVGIIVAGAGFSSGFYTRATHYGTEGYSIVPVTVPRLTDSLNEGKTIEETLAHRVDQVVLDRRWEE